MSINQSQSIAFLFAGQGNPSIGMGADLWNHSEQIRQIWDCASDLSGIDIRRICLKGPMNKLVQTTHQQIAVTAINVSLYTLCSQKINEVTIFGLCGHSVGEYAALYAANALTLEDLFRCICFRAQLMDELSKINKGGMLAVKNIDNQTLSQFITDSGIALDVSCDNSQRQQVVGGTAHALSNFSAFLNRRGYAFTKLAVSGAWHTRLMADGVKPMQDFLASVDIQLPQYRVFMNVDGLSPTHPEMIKVNLAKHLTHTVKWRSVMDHWLTQIPQLSLVEISHKAYLNHILSDFKGFSPEKSYHCSNIERVSSAI